MRSIASVEAANMAMLPSVQPLIVHSSFTSPVCNTDTLILMLFMPLSDIF